MRHRAGDGLTWYLELGYGYYPVVGGNAVYDRAYFQRYQAYTATPMGQALTAARVDLVRRWAGDAECLDIGIGAGDFLEARRPQAPTFGYDVNPEAVRWLLDRGAFRDPCHGPVACMTFWDSLEHLADPQIVLSQASRWAFITIPVFRGPDHVLVSKHFRKDEHFWYFTRAGLIGWMGNQGFVCAEQSTAETALGREDIETFAFERRQ